MSINVKLALQVQWVGVSEVRTLFFRKRRKKIGRKISIKYVF